MTAFQRKACLLVVEQRWLPLMRVVAALALLRLRAELPGVRIFVAAIALRCRICEAHMEHRTFHIGRPVALRAAHGAVRSHQREARLVVIEPAQVVPVASGVARLASRRSAAAGARRHTIAELSPMHIVVTRGASKRRKVERRHA